MMIKMKGKKEEVEEKKLPEEASRWMDGGKLLGSRPANPWVEEAEVSSPVVPRLATPLTALMAVKSGEVNIADKLGCGHSTPPA